MTCVYMRISLQTAHRSVHPVVTYACMTMMQMFRHTASQIPSKGNPEQSLGNILSCKHLPAKILFSILSSGMSKVGFIMRDIWIVQYVHQLNVCSAHVITDRHVTTFEGRREGSMTKITLQLGVFYWGLPNGLPEAPVFWTTCPHSAVHQSSGSNMYRNNGA